MNGFNSRLNRTKEGSGSIKTDSRIYSILSKEINYISIVSENYGTTIKKKKQTLNICVIKVLDKNTVLKNVQRHNGGSSLVVKWLGLGAAMAWGSIPGWRTKIPQAVCQGQKNQSIDQSWFKKKKRMKISKSGERPKSTDSRSCCYVASVMSDFLRSHGPQPTRLLCQWDSPGKNT